MLNPIINHMVIDNLPYYLILVLFNNLNQIPILYQCVVLLIVYIPPLCMLKGIIPVHP